MYQNIFDSHCHSENSPDAVHSVTFLAEAAIRSGVQGFSVTDHCECSDLKEQGFEMRQRQSALDVQMARAAFRGHVVITNGIELGQPAFNYAGAEHILSMQHYDFVLLSLHRMQGWQDFYYVDYARMSPDEIHGMMRQYFKELMELVEWGNFDVVAHLTLPLRYAKAHDQLDIDLTPYTQELEKALKALAQKGKGIEINTSGLRGALEDTLPPAWVIRRFRELGGQVVTIGSDAHRASDLGAGIQEAMQLLLDVGFEQFAFYRDRHPVMLRII